MGYQIGDEILSIERLPGRKSKSLNLWTYNEHVSWGAPLAYFRSDEAADVAERVLAALARGTLMPEAK